MPQIIADVEVIYMASDYGWFNPASGARSCHVLPIDMSRGYTKGDGVVQNACDISSRESKYCNVKPNS